MKQNDSKLRISQYYIPIGQIDHDGYVVIANFIAEENRISLFDNQDLIQSYIEMEDIKTKLFGYVKENTFKETDSLQSDTKIFVEGIFDSMGFALLLDYLETEFQISAEDSDLVEENFESINAIADFIAAKNPALV